MGCLGEGDDQHFDAGDVTIIVLDVALDFAEDDGDRLGGCEDSRGVEGPRNQLTARSERHTAGRSFRGSGEFSW